VASHRGPETARRANAERHDRDVGERDAGNWLLIVPPGETVPKEPLGDAKKVKGMRFIAVAG